jgi:thioredoxin 1
MLEILLYTVLTIIGFFVFMQIYVRLTGLMKKGKELGNINGELGRRIRTGRKLLVYFYSPSCGACRPMTPVIDTMKKESGNVFSVNLAKDMQTARAFGVMGTPATVVVDEGRIRKFILGARTEKYLRDLMG